MRHSWIAVAIVATTAHADALEVTLASDTSSTRVVMIDHPADTSGNTVLVSWDHVPGAPDSGALVFRRERGTHEVRYFAIGGHGPFWIIDRGRHALTAGTSVPVFELVTDDPAHPAPLRVVADQKIDLPAVLARYDAFEHLVVPPAERKYPFVREDRGYLAAKGKALERVVSLCKQNDHRGCGVLVGSLAAGVDRFAKGTAREIAMLVSGDIGPAEAMHFWTLAVADDPAACKEIGVERAVIAALSAGGDRVADAQKTAIACFASLESALTQELVATSDNSPYAKNACPVLKPRGAPTVLRQRREGEPVAIQRTGATLTVVLPLGGAPIGTKD